MGIAQDPRMMSKHWMEYLSPTAAYFPSSNLLQKKSGGYWTEQENKLFENALAYTDENSPDRWKKLADMIPGKTEADVLSHYQDLEEDVNHIEAGLIPFPGYSSSIMLDWESGQGYEGLKQAYCVGAKRSAGRTADQERKKGVPWTEEEHRMFLLGLKKYGKGDWRNISRNFVVSRTPTQVASHAQKYFIRISSGGSKEKRRSSIHDITTVNLPDTPSSPSQMQSNSSVDSNQHNEAASVFNPSVQFIHQPHYGVDAYRMKSQGQHFQNSVVGQRSMMFQMQPVQPYPHG